MIRNCGVTIADITHSNPNVVHEIGIADAEGKPVILLTQEDPKHVPFNLQHRNLIHYAPTSSSLATMKERLQATIRNELSLGAENIA